MAFLTQLSLHLWRDSRLQKDAAFDRLSRVADGKAWSRKCRLDVPAVIHDVGNELCMRKRLIRSAQNAGSYMLVAALHERRNNGVKRTFTRRERIWRLWVEHEEPSSILKQKAHPGYRDARAEIVVHALDHRGNVAIFVDHRQVRSIALCWRPAHHRTICFLGINQRGAFFCVLFGKQALDWDARETGITVVAIQIGISELHRLDLLV